MVILESSHASAPLVFQLHISVLYRDSFAVDVKFIYFQNLSHDVIICIRYR